jgi:putative addiction module CopG family antidote
LALAIFALFCYDQLVNISLPAEMRAFLEAEVASGAYATTSEVVRDAIRLYQRRKAEDAARLEALCAMRSTSGSRKPIVAIS